MMEFNKQISHVSWTFSACQEATREVQKETKEALKFPPIYNFPIFNQYTKHLSFSLKLLKQAEKIWGNMIQTNRVHTSEITNMQNVYVKRSLFQHQVAMDYLLQMTYEREFHQDFLCKNLYQKNRKLHQIMEQLMQQIQKLQSLSL